MVVVLVFEVVELVARDRSVDVRKSMVADIRRLRAPAGPLTTLRHKPLLSLVTLRESCCLASLVCPSPTLPHPSLPNFFLIHQPPTTNQPTSTFLLLAIPWLHIHLIFTRLLWRHRASQRRPLCGGSYQVSPVRGLSFAGQNQLARPLSTSGH